jgi:uncharacterized protein (TIGR03435 family)
MTALMILAVSAGVARSQSPLQVPAESFEVVSVKLNQSAVVDWDFDSPPGRVVGTNVLLRDLIRFAYYVYGGDWEARIAGPDWIKSARFDVDARTPGPVTTPRAMSMLRSLLADRFKLKAHFEQRDVSAYALVVARHDRRLGPQLTRSSIDCAAITAFNEAARAAGTAPAMPFDPDKPPVCGSRGTAGSLSAGGLTMTQIGLILTRHAGRQVIDRTELPGVFDLELRWAPDPSIGARDASLPSIFTALEEQLGLKLEPARLPIDVLVIDRVEQPTSN